MTADSFGQTFIVEPSTPFAEIAGAIERLGWTRRAASAATPSLIPGEPETATWTWQGGKPFIVYTFNPVARMRVLDVATLPPAFRAALAGRLPLMPPERIPALLSAAEPRERLLGIWSAVELERIDLVDAVGRLSSDSEPLVADRAREAAARLEQIAQARLRTFAALQTLVQSAPPLIRKMSDPVFVRGLKPTPAECEACFDPGLTEKAAEAAARIYGDPPLISPVEPDARIDATAAPAGLLRWPNELSDRFPRAYRDIAGWMRPERIWLTWTISPPGGGRVRYDGLVWLGSRWAWLPKIYRWLGPECVPAGPDESKLVH